MEGVPLATYRLQFSARFTFDDAARIVPYLKALGISHVYASPFLKARAGSTHGYDIVDHNAFNPELGGEAAFYRFSDALRGAGLGLILDFVPNHMGIGHADNPWWLDVLEWGQRSPYAASFDIDWNALPHRRQPGVLLPILGKPYGEALRDGELALKYDAAEGTFAVWYADHKLPIGPPRYGDILRQIIGIENAANTETGAALLALAERYNTPATPGYRDAPAFKHALAAVPGAAALIERGLRAYRADHAEGMVLLHRLLERQHYRLAYWRVAFSAINYRRFFDINDLAGVRMEHPATFRAAHGLVARLIAEDRLQGLRIDHIDGLRDPMQYIRRLRQLTRQIGQPRCYVVVEKILEGDEPLPRRFTGVHGTTGYEWLNVIARVLVKDDGLAPLEATWRDFTGERQTLTQMLDRAKARVLDTMLASEFTVLTQQLSRIAAGHYSTRDYTLDRLRAALDLYVREFPVYRTYVATTGPSPRDRDTILATIARARARWQGPDPDIFAFLRDCLTLDLAGSTGYSAARVRNFAARLQQFTGPLMAKALEDTAFYRHHRLIALNEVGGAPAAAGLSVAEFHARMQARLRNAPLGLTATATHDTKRGEDARARILALSELAPDWSAAVERWRALNAPLVERRGVRRAPSAAHEYMLYQTLIGSWPADGPDDDFVERIVAYAVKAAREGKQETSWINPDADYEAALTRFVRGLLSRDNAAFLAAFGDFAARAALLGALNGLSQLTLKATMPGVPDFYQGTELWDLSLVDPDNRRPVDFATRAQRLRETPDWSALTRDWRSGAVKLHLIARLMRLRTALPALFLGGGYEPLTVTGDDGGSVAFLRFDRRHRVMVVAAGHCAAVSDGGRIWPQHWRGRITLPAPRRPLFDALRQGHMHDSETVELGSLLMELPVAVLSTLRLD